MSVIYGFYDPNLSAGGYSDPATDTVGVNDPTRNYVFGAFTGDGGLPTSVNSQADLDALWDAMQAKVDEIDTAGITINAVVNDLRVRGGAGMDIITVDAVTGYIDGRNGLDQIITSGGGDYTIFGRNGEDAIYSGAGDDIIDAGRGDDNINDAGNSTVDGGEGRDILTLISNVAMILDGEAGTWTSSAGEGTFRGVERIIVAGGGADHLTFGGDLVSLNGLEGDDTLVGVDGFDYLQGHWGSDVIFASLGDDILEAGGKAGSLSSGFLWADTLDCSRLAAGVTIGLHLRGAQDTGGAGNDRLSGFENVTGTDFADVLTGDTWANELVGGFGSDALTGGRDKDTLDGGRGDDTLVGGLEADQLSGGDGRDLFAWDSIGEARSGRVTDTIVDLQDRDTIDVSRIDADFTTDGNQAFVIGGARLSGVAGELAIRYDAANDRTVFSFDIDGDGVADMIIRALGNHADYSSFVL